MEAWCIILTHVPESQSLSPHFKVRGDNVNLGVIELEVRFTPENLNLCILVRISESQSGFLYKKQSFLLAQDLLLVQEEDRLLVQESGLTFTNSR